ARETLNVSDIEWVIHASRLQPRLERKIHAFPKVGLVNGLAVVGAGQGALMEIEVTVIVTTKEKGTMNVTGIVEEEQTGNQAHSVRRKSMAKGSLENVLTVLRKMGLNTDDYDIHVNFPGGTPVDGPSAGIAIAAGIYSAIKEIPINNELAMTGEVGIHGTVKAVGGVAVKVEAAIEAGAKKIIIPKANEQSLFKKYEQIEIIPVSHITDVLYHALNIVVQEEDTIPAHSQMEGTVTFV
ncbi:MAG TPA: ATP-dependent protease LonB, partial [Bacilli bacterium]|nr:ATP-dependent protease LonB [Bacilli bacterium]